jgi:hypothetical protein
MVHSLSGPGNLAAECAALQRELHEFAARPSGELPPDGDEPFLDDDCDRDVPF